MKAQRTGTRGRGRGLQTDALKQALQGRPGGRGRGASVRGRISARGRGIGGGGQKQVANTVPISPVPTTAARGGRGRGRRGRGGRVGGAVAERNSEVEVSVKNNSL